MEIMRLKKDLQKKGLQSVLSWSWSVLWQFQDYHYEQDHDFLSGINS